jgi:hypothetical protein
MLTLLKIWHSLLKNAEGLNSAVERNDFVFASISISDSGDRFS